MEFLAIGDRKGAWTQFTLAVQADADCPEAYFEMGRFQHHLGNLTAADRWYKRALAVEKKRRLKPQASAHRALIGTRIGRGMIAWQKKRWRSAVEHFDQAVSEGYVPSEFIQQVMGECRLRLGRVREAVEDFRKASWCAEGLMNFGLALFALGDLDGAMATLRRAFFYQPDAAEVLLEIHSGREVHANAAGAGLAAGTEAGAVWGASASRPEVLLESGGRYAERCRDLWDQTEGAMDFLSALWSDPQVEDELEQARRMEKVLRAAADSPKGFKLKRRLDRLRSPVRLHNSQTHLLHRIRRQPP